LEKCITTNKFKSNKTKNLNQSKKVGISNLNYKIEFNIIYYVDDVWWLVSGNNGHGKGNGPKLIVPQKISQQ